MCISYVQARPVAAAGVACRLLDARRRRRRYDTVIGVGVRRRGDILRTKFGTVCTVAAGSWRGRPRRTGLKIRHKTKL
jgi:hypothetical protein